MRDVIWRRQYAIDPDETYRAGLKRVARHVASAALDEGLSRGREADEYMRRIQRYEWLLKDDKFLPGGRILAGAGTEHGNLLNCFVVDASPLSTGTTEGVLLLAKKLALITKVGGGTGVNLDPIPPKSEVPADFLCGDAFVTIDQDHPDFDDVMTGTYYNQVRGEYVTKGYKQLYFTRRTNAALMNSVPVILVEDSVEGIWDAAREMVRHVMRGENVVIDLSNLRVDGAMVHGSGGTSSGPASFAVEVFDNFLRWAKLGGAEHAGPVATLRYVFAPTLRAIRQGGTRRGAGMATLSITHPDVRDFITAKDLDREAAEGDISTYNISVLATNDFMGDATYADVMGREREESKLLREIAEHAWATGEPGLIFVDTINENNAAREAYGDIVATNPCVTGDSLVLTTAGPKRFDELARNGNDVEVWSYQYDGAGTMRPVPKMMRQPRKTGEDMPLLAIEVEHSHTIKATSEHPFYVADGDAIVTRPAHKLKVGDKVMTPCVTFERDGEEDTEAFYPFALSASTDWGVITAVRDGGTADVYNGTVDGTHNYIILDPEHVAEYDGSLEPTEVFGVLTHNCGEIPLYPGEPCDLGAINLAAFVKAGSRDENPANRVDWDALEDTVRAAVNFLDDVLTVEKAPLPEIAESIKRFRRIGLGVMGLGDLLIRLGLKYDSVEGRDFVRHLITKIRNVALDESVTLGDRKGVPEGVARSGYQRRNIAILTVAPTGTTSMLAGVSSGVEPVYSAVTYRRVGTEYHEIVHPLLVELLNKADLHAMTGTGPTLLMWTDTGIEWNLEQLKAAISEHHGSIQPLIDKGLLPDTPELRAFLTAHDITPEGHVLMQATVQQSFDVGTAKIGNSISKTINLPNSATVQDVFDAYRTAWVSQCKGITVYRDGSRDLQVLNTNKAPETQEEERKQNGSVTHTTSTSGSEGTERLSNAGGVILEDVMRDTYEYVPQPYPELAPFEQSPSSTPPVFPANTYDVTFHPSQPERPQRVEGATHKFDINGRKVYVTINKNPQGDIVETFINLSRPTDSERVAADIIGRLISLAFKHGAEASDVTKHLAGHMDATGGFIAGKGYVHSMWDVVAEAITSEEKENPPTSSPPLPTEPIEEPTRTITRPTLEWDTTEGEYVSVVPASPNSQQCPSCGAPLVREEGCMKCYACGYAACG